MLRSTWRWRETWPGRHSGGTPNERSRQQGTHTHPQSTGPLLFLDLVSRGESAKAFRFSGTLHDLRVGNCANDILIAGSPVFFHGAAGELVVLGDAFLVLGVVDQSTILQTFSSASAAS